MTVFRKPGFSAITTGLCVFLGAALQIQATIGVSDTSFGLRMNLADLALPLLGLIVLGSLLLKKTVWPHWAILYGWLWPVALTAVIGFSFWNGYAATGELSQWALINKFIGWFILMAYFGLGGWIATNAGGPAIRLFLKSFLTAFLAICLCQGTYLLLGDFGILGADRISLQGLMGNRNAMALMILIATGIFGVFSLSGRDLMPRWVWYGYMALLPLVLILSGSRAMWIAILVLLLSFPLLYGRKSARTLLLFIGSAVLTCALLYAAKGETGIFRQNQNDRLPAITQQAPQPNTYLGDHQRLRVLQDSLSFWKDSPATGIGLGTFLYRQDQKYKDNPPPIPLGIIDSTPLWILVETGILGTLVFAAFFAVTLLSLWNSGVHALQNADDISTLRTAVFLCALGFVCMSLFHELLYTRILWFMLGLSLAACPRTHPHGSGTTLPQDQIRRQP